jgi:hypothetical protein
LAQKLHTPLLAASGRRIIVRQVTFFAWLMGMTAALQGQNPWPDAGSVAAAMTLANNYWIASNFTNGSYGNSDWARAAYFTGNQRAARVLANRTGKSFGRAAMAGYLRDWRACSSK